MLGLLIFLVGFPIVIGLASVFGYVIVEPIAKAVRGKRWTSRFCVSDFFPLSFLLAIPLVFVAAIRRLPGQDTIFVNVVSIILTGVFVYAWWRGTVTLSRIGVLHTGRRCVFLGILIPTAVLGSAVGVPLLVVMAFRIPRMPTLVFAAWLSGIIAVPIIVTCCRRAAHWVVSDQNVSQNGINVRSHAR